MDTRRLGCTVLGLTLFAVLDGFILGLLAGWWAVPVVEMDRGYGPEQQTGYILMVAASYAVDNDLRSAQERLSILEPDLSLQAKVVIDMAQQAIEQRDNTNAKNLIVLAVALGGDTEPLLSQLPATPTAVPTFTATPQPTPVTVATVPPAATISVSAANVAIATATPVPPTSTPTSTPRPTNTPTRRPPLTPTRRPLRPTATATAIVPEAPTATPTPNIDYRVAKVRQLTPCENGGNHHLFMMVVDTQGRGVPGVTIEVVWDGGSYRDVTGRKVENIPTLGVDNLTTPGFVDYAMYKGRYRAKVLNGISEQTPWLTVDIPVDELCPSRDNPVGNSLFHYSYLIVFQKVR